MASNFIEGKVLFQPYTKLVQDFERIHEDVFHRNPHAQRNDHKTILINEKWAKQHCSKTYERTKTKFTKRPN